MLQSRPPKLFPPSSLQQLCQKFAHFIWAAPSRLKTETKQHKSMERMLRLCFFFFFLEFSTLHTMPLPLKQEVGSTGGEGHHEAQLASTALSEPGVT